MQVEESIRSNQYSSVRELFTEEGWEIYTRLVNYGSAKIVGSPSYKFLQSGDVTYCRGIQMAFSFSRGVRKSFVEDVVFTFDSDHIISNVAFGLGNTAADDILNKGVWSESARIALMNFLENYKTAYALKRLDYITSIFDDNAVIIVGNVTHVAQSSQSREFGQVTFGGQDIIKRNRYTMDQYLANLKRCFACNEFLKIRFANYDVL